SDDGTVDYFDENGKSIRHFLLLNPVPNGIFKSGFGMRLHPILGFARMHTGVGVLEEVEARLRVAEKGVDVEQFGILGRLDAAVG
ncbi:hypothetical protein ACC704_37590, partial [Rhizobium johnstonii]|uniref:hypothetical protein n=1 Tax=Rhizobium johnstonii TaxID=3019933 RepID=UPI003F960ACC